MSNCSISVPISAISLSQMTVWMQYLVGYHISVHVSNISGMLDGLSLPFIVKLQDLKSEEDWCYKNKSS